MVQKLLKTLFGNKMADKSIKFNLVKNAWGATHNEHINFKHFLEFLTIFGDFWIFAPKPTITYKRVKFELSRQNQQNWATLSYRGKNNFHHPHKILQAKIYKIKRTEFSRWKLVSFLPSRSKEIIVIFKMKICKPSQQNLLVRNAISQHLVNVQSANTVLVTSIHRSQTGGRTVVALSETGAYGGQARLLGRDTDHWPVLMYGMKGGYGPRGRQAGIRIGGRIGGPTGVQTCGGVSAAWGHGFHGGNAGAALISGTVSTRTL